MCLCVGTAEPGKCLCVGSAGKCKCVCVGTAEIRKCLCVESATRATHKATHNHAGCLSLGCSVAIAPSRGRSVATLLSRPVGFPPSAGSHQRGQSLRGHRCTPCEVGNIHCEPCGAFVVRKSFRMLLGQQQFHPTQQPPQQASVTLNSPQPKASPPSLPRSSVLAFAPLPALSLRAVGLAASLRLSVRSGGSAFVCGLSRLLWWLLCGVFLLLFYKCKSKEFTSVKQRVYKCKL